MDMNEIVMEVGVVCQLGHPLHRILCPQTESNYEKYNFKALK